MSRRFTTSSLARLCARHPWLVISFWILLMACAAGASLGLASILTADDMESTDRPESVLGAELLQERLGTTDPEMETLIIRSATYVADDEAFMAAAQKVATDVAALEGTVASVVTPYQLQTFSPEAAASLISKDRHTILVPVVLAQDSAETAAGGSSSRDLIVYLETVANQSIPGFQVLTIGGSSMDDEFQSTAASDLMKAEMFGFPLTLLVLIVVFGAVVAAGVSMILAGSAILVAVGATALVGQFVELSFFVVNIVTMIGMAVGIDYALFITERYREERRLGASKMEAISIAGGTASKAVLFSGVTVLLALTGLFLVPITTFRSLGVGAVLVVSAAVVAMLTLVPAILSVLGDRIDWPRRKKAPSVSAANRPPGPSSVYGGFWGRLTKQVMKRPVVSAATACLLLLLATTPYISLERGASGAEGLPEGNLKTAYEILAKDFSAGMMSPLEVVVDAERTPALEQQIERLRALAANDRVFGPAGQIQWSSAGDLAVVELPLTVEANSQEAAKAVQLVRETLVPEAFRGSTAPVLVTGSPALNADSIHAINRYTPAVFAFVLGLSFVVLLLVFRSLVVPVKAIIMNLLSVGAAYGILVLVFQKGLGKELFGFQQTSTIEAWVPIFLFCILFGLSMDYHVFLLSRIREHFDLTQRNLESVAVGLKATGRIITGAALIMVIVFSTFAAGKLVMMQQVGFGLAVAILIDATLVRFVLVPATMALLGNVNWYLPRWLSWLPDLRMEGRRSKPDSRPPVE